jgi:hypothetical protein
MVDSFVVIAFLRPSPATRHVTGNANPVRPGSFPFPALRANKPATSPPASTPIPQPPISSSAPESPDQPSSGIAATPPAGIAFSLKSVPPIEAGGAAFDIDGDGDLDVVFGEDWLGHNLYWWENPYPNFNPDIPWKRHTIKIGGQNQHHDQIFADFESTGKPQLVFWNQFAKTLFLAQIPPDPRHAESWPYVPIFSGNAGEGEQNAAQYAEGLDAFDVDGDGKVDLLAGNYWFKYLGNHKFQPIKVGKIGGRIRAGRFKPGKYPQIVIAPGDGSALSPYMSAPIRTILRLPPRGRDMTFSTVTKSTDTLWKSPTSITTAIWTSSRPNKANGPPNQP